MTQMTANTNDGDDTGALFLDIVARRRSMRDFKPDPVPTEIIESVFGGAQRAPSNCNTQPWFVHVSFVSPHVPTVSPKGQWDSAYDGRPLPTGTTVSYTHLTLPTIYSV